jgi:YfiR/HmsC-like
MLLIGAVSFAFAAPLDLAGGEYQKKAELITNILKFVEWQPRKFVQADSPFVVGVFGTDQISDYLREAIQGRSIKARRVVIKHLMFKEELSGVHVLYVSRSEAERLNPVLGAVRREGVLTIGECDNFLSRGGVVNFVRTGSGIRFEINASNAERQRLKVDARLLSLSLRPAPERD